MINQNKNKENSGNIAMAVFVGILFAFLVYPHIKPIFDAFMRQIAIEIMGGR